VESSDGVVAVVKKIRLQSGKDTIEYYFHY